MKLFVTDTETTGLNPSDCDLIEVGAILFDTETSSVLETYQSLLYNTANACEHINHISPKALSKVPKDQLLDVKDILKAMASCADYVIAHNAAFDKGFYEANGIGFDDTPWVCSQKDIVYPGKHKSLGLGHLCYDFDIPVFNAHTAIGDVTILIELLKKVPDLEEQLKKAGEPKETYVAMVDFSEKEKAKKAGFNWNKSKKLWTKDIKVSEVDLVKANAGFPIQKIS